MRRRQRSERGLSFNESNSQQYNNQQSDNEKVFLVTGLVVETSEKLFYLKDEISICVFNQNA